MITEEIKEQIKEMYYKGRTKTDISDILGFPFPINNYNKKDNGQQKED